MRGKRKKLSSKASRKLFKKTSRAIHKRNLPSRKPMRGGRRM